MSANEIIIHSVGKKGINKFEDVSAVQDLLNGCIHLLIPFKLLACDGKAGPLTINAIEQFQSRVGKMKLPDGRVDPRGKTLRLLNQYYLPASTKKGQYFISTAPVHKVWNYQFPLKITPRKPYTSGGRQFGANRKLGRKHAGCDLLAPIGTPVYAMDDGEVSIDVYAFYLGTLALEIKHPDFVARYGEIGSVASGIKKGAKVKKGQLIAYVGKLRGLSFSMLHLELYSGSGVGKLTVRGNKPYQRRSDLINPTKILQKAKR